MIRSTRQKRRTNRRRRTRDTRYPEPTKTLEGYGCTTKEWPTINCRELFHSQASRSSRKRSIEIETWAHLIQGKGRDRRRSLLKQSNNINITHTLDWKRGRLLRWPVNKEHEEGNMNEGRRFGLILLFCYLSMPPTWSEGGRTDPLWMRVVTRVSLKLNQYYNIDRSVSIDRSTEQQRREM